MVFLKCLQVALCTWIWVPFGCVPFEVGWQAPLKCCTGCRNTNAGSNLSGWENRVAADTLEAVCQQLSFAPGFRLPFLFILLLHLRFSHLSEDTRVCEINPEPSAIACPLPVWRWCVNPHNQSRFKHLSYPYFAVQLLCSLTKHDACMMPLLRARKRGKTESRQEKIVQEFREVSTDA